MTVTVIVVSAPLAVAPTGVPWTWKVYEPATTVDATLIGKLLVAPAEVGVTGFTLKVPQVIPVGRLEHAKVTG